MTTVECDGCGATISEPNDDHRVDDRWCCHNCAYAAIHGRGPFADVYPEDKP